LSHEYLTVSAEQATGLGVSKVLFSCSSWAQATFKNANNNSRQNEQTDIGYNLARNDIIRQTERSKEVTKFTKHCSTDFGLCA
jgi:hypothetical protein